MPLVELFYLLHRCGTGGGGAFGVEGGIGKLLALIEGQLGQLGTNAGDCGRRRRQGVDAKAGQ